VGGKRFVWHCSLLATMKKNWRSILGLGETTLLKAKERHLSMSSSLNDHVGVLGRLCSSQNGLRYRAFSYSLVFYCTAEHFYVALCYCDFIVTTMRLLFIWHFRFVSLILTMVLFDNYAVTGCLIGSNFVVVLGRFLVNDCHWIVTVFVIPATIILSS